jgi:hypothetical protein
MPLNVLEKNMFVLNHSMTTYIKILRMCINFIKSIFHYLFCSETELEWKLKFEMVELERKELDDLKNQELSDLKSQLAQFEFGKIESDQQNLDILDQLKAENETIKGGKISEGLFNWAPSQKKLTKY